MYVCFISEFKKWIIWMMCDQFLVNLFTFFLAITLTFRWLLLCCCYVRICVIDRISHIVAYVKLWPNVEYNIKKINNNNNNSVLLLLVERGFQITTITNFMGEEGGWVGEKEEGKFDLFIPFIMLLNHVMFGKKHGNIIYNHHRHHYNAIA